MAELDGGENEALDLVPLVTNVVLEVLDNFKIKSLMRTDFRNTN